jgi:hypothetical protein
LQNNKLSIFGTMISAACNADQKGGPRMGGKRRVRPLYR